jgi:hypothetical protein
MNDGGQGCSSNVNWGHHAPTNLQQPNLYIPCNDGNMVLLLLLRPMTWINKLESEGFWHVSNYP